MKKMSKNSHHNFTELCLKNSPKPKDIQFTMKSESPHLRS